MLTRARQWITRCLTSVATAAITAYVVLAASSGCSALPAFAPPSPTPSSIPPTLTWTVDPPTASPAPPSTAAPTQTPTLAPGMPPQVADPLWAANESDGNLLLIDPADNSVAVIVPTNLNPRWVVVGDKDVWALDPTHDALIQVDALDYTIVRTIPFPERDVDALAVSADAVWVAYTERAGLLFLLPQEDYAPEGGILRIDPDSGAITGTIPTGPVVALSVQPAPAYLWALTRGPVDTPLLRIDPQTLTSQPVSLSGNAGSAMDDAFTLTADGMWLYTSALGKVYHHAIDGRLYAEIAVGRHKPLSPPALLAVEGDIWLASPWSTLLRIDPGQRKIVAEISLATPAASLTYASGAVWALSPLGGTAYRVDPASNTIVAQVGLGEPVRPTPRVSPTPIQRASKPCEDAPYSRLAPGARAATPREPALPNRIHIEPGKDAEVTGYILPGQSVLILEGPECKEGWVWWEIRNEINKVEGWVAEGDELEYWLIPLK